MKKHFHIQYHFIFGVYKLLFRTHICLNFFWKKNMLSSPFKPKMDYIIFTCSQCYGLYLFRKLQCLFCCLVIHHCTAMLLGYCLCPLDFYLIWTVIHFFCYCHAQHIVHITFYYCYIFTMIWTHLIDISTIDETHLVDLKKCIIWYLMIQSTCMTNRLWKHYFENVKTLKYNKNSISFENLSHTSKLISVIIYSIKIKF